MMMKKSRKLVAILVAILLAMSMSMVGCSMSRSTDDVIADRALWFKAKHLASHADYIYGSVRSEESRKELVVYRDDSYARDETSTQSQDNGVFEFVDLSPGIYSFSATLYGWWRADSLPEDFVSEYLDGEEMRKTACGICYGEYGRDYCLFN